MSFLSVFTTSLSRKESSRGLKVDAQALMHHGQIMGLSLVRLSAAAGLRGAEE